MLSEIVNHSFSRSHVNESIISRKWVIFLLVGVFLCCGQLFAVSAPGIAYTTTKDTNSNGFIDQVIVEFTATVTIYDSDPGGFSPLGFDGYKVQTGDYSMTNQLTQTFNLEEGLIEDTGKLIDVMYVSGTTAGSIVDSAAVEMLNGTTANNKHDGAPAVLMDASATDQASGEMLLRFSEPVFRAGSQSSTLVVSDLNYTNNSSDGVSAISAMGSDSDGSDTTVSVLVNTSFLSSDYNSDTVNVVAGTLVDGAGNPNSTSNVLLDTDFGSGAAVDIELVDHSTPNGLFTSANSQVLAILDITTVSGQADITSMVFSTTNISAADFSSFSLVHNSTTVSTGSFNSSLNTLTFNFSPGLTIGTPITFLRLEGILITTPTGGSSPGILGGAPFIGFDLFNTDVQVSINGGPSVPNGGPAGVVAQAYIPVSGSSSSSGLSVSVDSGFTRPSLNAGASDIMVMGFSLNPNGGSHTVTDFNVVANSTNFGDITAAKLIKLGISPAPNTTIATGVLANSNTEIQFSSINQVLTVNENWGLEITVSSSPTSSGLDFYVNPLSHIILSTGTASGGGISETYSYTSSSTGGGQLSVGFSNFSGFTLPSNNTMTVGVNEVLPIKFQSTGTTTINSLTVQLQEGFIGDISSASLINTNSFPENVQVAFNHDSIIFGNWNKTLNDNHIFEFVLEVNLVTNPVSNSMKFAVVPSTDVGMAQGSVDSTSATQDHTYTITGSGSTDSLQLSANSFTPTSTQLSSGSFSNEVMQFVLQSTNGNVDLRGLLLEVVAGNIADIANVNIYDGNTFFQIGSIPGTGSVISFMGLFESVGSSQKTYTISVDLKSSVTSSSLQFRLKPESVLTSGGIGVGTTVTSQLFSLNNIVVVSNVNFVDAEINPGHVEINQSTSFTAHFKPDLQSGDNGFNYIELVLPPDTGSIANIALSSSSSASGTYTTIAGTTNVINTTSFSLTIPTTEASSGSFYKLSFDATITEPNNSAGFGLVLDNTNSPQEVHAFGHDVDGVFNNDNMFVVAFGVGNGQPVLQSAQAEILPATTIKNTTESFDVFAVLTPTSTNPGFNRLEVTVPYFNEKASNVAFEIGGSAVTPTETVVDYGKIVLKFNTAQIGSTVKVSFDLHVPEFAPGKGVFGISFDNTANLNPAFATWGNANGTANDNDTLEVVANHGGSLSLFDQSDAAAEITPGNIEINKTQTFTLIVKTTMENSESWSFLGIDLPAGFKDAKEVSVKINGVAASSSEVTVDTNDATKIGVTFTSAQNTSKIYSVSFKLTAPEIVTRVPGEEKFNVHLDANFVKSGATGSSTSTTSSLRVQAYANFSTSIPMDGASASISTFDSLEPNNFVYLSMIVKTTKESGSTAVGFNALSIEVPGDINPSDGVTITDENNSLQSGSDYQINVKRFQEKNFIDIKFTNTQTASDTYTINFNAQLPVLPGQRSFDVFLVNLANWNPEKALPETAGALTLNIQSQNFGTTPNVDHIIAELGSVGSLFAGDLGEFVLYFSPEFTTGQSVNLLNLSMPPGFGAPENLKVLQGSTLYTKDVHYQVLHDITGAISILLTTPLTSSNGHNEVFKIEYESSIPFDATIAFANFGMDNTNSLFFESALGGDVTNSNASNSLSLDVGFRQATGINADGVEFEVGPNSGLKTDTSVDLSVYFKVDITSSSHKGFDLVRIEYPFDFAVPAGISVSSASGSSASFNLWGGSLYTVDTQEFGVIKIKLNTTQTSTTSDGGYYKVSFNTRTGFIPGEENFGVEVNNSTNLLPVRGHGTDVVSTEANNKGSVNLISGFAFQGSNVSDLVAEVATFDTSGNPAVFAIETSTNVTFGVFLRATVSDLDQGFNFLGIDFPFEFVLNASSITVSTSVTGSSLTKDTDYTVRTEDGFIGITLTSKVAAPSSGTKQAWYLVKFSAKTPDFPELAYFGASVDSLTNPASYFAFPGNAEVDPNSTTPTSNLLTRDQLDLPIKPGSGAAIGHSVKDQGLSAELEVDSPPARTNSDVDVTFIVKADATGANGFNEMAIFFPFGFSKSGSVSIETTNGTLTAFTTKNVEATTNDPAFLRISFTNVQTGINTYFIKMKVKTPLSADLGYFEVAVKNKSFVGSEAFAHWADVDGDDAFGSLELFTSAPVGTGINVSSFNFELAVTTEHGGVDLGHIETDKTPTWQVFIKPNFDTNDKGFNFISLFLPGYLDNNNPSSVSISTMSSSATSLSSTPNLTLNSDYTVTFPESNIINISMTTLQKKSNADGLVYVVSFSKKVTPYPDFMFVDVVLDNLSNFSPVFGFIGDSDNSISSTRNDSGFPVSGSFSSAPNVTEVDSEVVTTSDIKTDSTGAFSVYIKTQVSSGDKGIDSLKFFYPFDLTNIKVTTIASTLDVTSTYSDSLLTALSSVDYTVDTSIEGEVDVTLNSALTSSAIIKVEFTVNTPPFPIFAFVDVEVNNSSNYSPFLSFEGDVNGDNAGHKFFDVFPSFSFDSLKEIASSAVSEVVVIPESGVHVETNTKPNINVLLTPTITSAESGFDLMEIFAPPGYTMPEKANAYSVYRATTPGGLASTKLELNTDYKVKTKDAAIGQIIIEFTSVQDQTKSGYHYRVEFTPTAPEFDGFGFFDLIISNKVNPLPFFPAWGDVAGAGVITSSTNEINNNTMELQVNIGYAADAFTKFNLTDLTAEINVTGTAKSSTEIVHTLAIKPVIGSNDRGINRIGIEMPFDYGTPSVQSVNKVVAGVSTALTNQSSFKSENNLLLIKLTDTITDTSDFYIEVKFKAISFSFPGLAFFGVAATNSVSPQLFYAFPNNVDGVANNDNLELDIHLNTESDDFDLSTVLNAFDKPLAEELTVEVSPRSATAGTAKQAFTVYLSAKNASANSHGFNIVDIFIPPSFKNVAGIEVYTSTPSSSSTDAFSRVVNGLASDPKVKDGVLTVKFSSTNIRGQNQDEKVKISFVADMSKFTGVEFIEAGIRNTNFPLLSAFAFFGDATNAIDTNDNLVFIEPDFSSFDLNKRPLEKFAGEINYSSATVGKTATIEYYLYVEKGSGSSFSGFDFIELFLPFDFGVYSNLKISSAASGSLDNAPFSSLTFTELRSSAYTVNATDPYFPKIQLTNTHTATGGYVYKLSFNTDAPFAPAPYFFDARVLDTTNLAKDMFPFFQDIVATPTGYRSQDNFDVFVFPDLTAPVTNDYVVDLVTAEANSGTIKTNEKGKVTLTVKAENNGGTGFDRINIQVDEALTLVSLDNVSKNGTKVINLQKNTSDKSNPFVKFTDALQSTNAGSADVYTIELTVTAPEFPLDAFFRVELDSSKLGKPEHALPGDANGVATDSNNMFISVIPDRAAVYTEAALAIDNIKDMLAEAVFVSGSSTSKEIEASTTATVRVLVKPEFDADNRGVNIFKLALPLEFGTPSNVTVYATTVAGTLGSKLGALKDYAQTISSVTNEIKIDFSKYSILNSTTVSNTTSYLVEFDSVMPEDPGEYFVGVEADNKTFSIPTPAVFGDVNNNNDDDADGVENGFGDNHTFLRVIPKTIANIASITNVEQVSSEIVSSAKGELGTTVTLALATKVTYVAGQEGYNRLFIDLGTEFQNVTGFSMSYATDSGTLNPMQVISDYKTKLDNPENLKVEFTSVIQETRIIYTTLNMDLPTRTGLFDFGVVVDNSSTPKAAAASPADVVVNLGTNGLSYFVDPVAITITENTKQPLTALTAKVVSPDSMSVSQTTPVTLTVSATVGSDDQGFDILEIDSAELSNFSDFKIVSTVTGGSATQLLNILDYKTFKTNNGTAINFTTPYTTDVVLSISFKAQSGATPGPALFNLAASNKVLPFVIPASLDSSSNARLDVSVVPAKKSAAELAVAPAQPVSSLSVDLIPATATASSSVDVSVFVSATSDSGNSGFDQLRIKVPKSWGTVNTNHIQLFTYTDSNFSGTGTLKQAIKDYTVSQGKFGNLNFKLLTTFLTGTTATKSAYIKVLFTGNLPALPKTYKLGAVVNNSQNPFKVKAKKEDLNGDGKANRKIVASPAVVTSSSSTTSAASELVPSAFASLKYTLSNGSFVLPTASQKSYKYSIVLKAASSNRSSGFDTINLGMPKDFDTLKVNGVSTVSSAGTKLSLAKGSTGYTEDIDETEKLISLKFGSVQKSSSATADISYYQIDLETHVAPVPGSYHHHIKLFNSTNGLSLDVAAGLISGAASGEPGSLSAEVQKATVSGTAKSGFFGEISPTTAVVTGLTGIVRAFDGTSFTSTLASTTDASHKVLVQSTPVLSASDPGFDYMKIELPAGGGVPSNIVIYTTGSGNSRYLQEFYDYQVVATAGDLTIKFIDEKSVSAPINATKMGNDTVMNITFDMGLPKRLGRHFFDVFVLNTAVPGDIYYIDPVIGLRDVSTSLIKRSADVDGTRFLYLDITNSSASAVVSGLKAEITAIGQSIVPVGASRNMRVDIGTTLSSGESFNAIEIQFPQDFGALTGFSLDQGLQTLAEFSDYTIDLTHPRVATVVFTTPQSSSATFTARFALQTPPQIEGVSNNVTYQFAVLAFDSIQSNSILTTNPVYATPADVTIDNGGNDLNVVVMSKRIISGTVNFGTPLLAKTKVALDLYKVENGQQKFVATSAAMASAPEAGSSRAGFVFSQESALEIAGISNGVYKIKVSAPQYSTVWLDATISDTVTSVGGLFADLQPEDIQAVVSFSPYANIQAGQEKSITAKVNVRLNNSATNLNSLTFSFAGRSGAVGAFESLSVSDYKVDTVSVTNGTSLVSQSGQQFVVNTSGFGASNSQIDIVLAMKAGATQDGIYDFSNALIANSTTVSYKAYGSKALETSDPSSLFSVGAPVRFSSTELKTRILGRAFVESLPVVSVVSSELMSFSQTGLPSDLGVSLNSSGVLSGTPAKTSKTGFPFTVTLDYTLPFSVPVAGSLTESTNSGTITQDFVLKVERLNFAVYAIEPAAVPTTGGEIVLRGAGFTVDSKVSLESGSVSATFVDSKTLVVTVPSLSAGKYSVFVEDAGDFAGIPNSVNNNSLVVAEAKSFSQAFAASVTEGQTPTALDYNIVGIQSFYQAHIKDMLISALGPFSTKSWRAFGYHSSAYIELGDMDSADNTKVKSGTGFWLINRSNGTVQASGVEPSNVPNYTVAIPAESWALIANLYSSSIVWKDVTILAGDPDNPKAVTVSSEDNSYVNQTLWAMDKSSTNLKQPYKAAAILEPGKGYWVYNKSRATVTVKIDKPSSNSQKATDLQALYKPEENQPPEAPVAVQESASAAGLGAGGGGGGCFLK